MAIETEDRRAGDGALMARLGRGETAALEVLIERHGRKLYGFLLRLCGAKDRAEDVYQEVWMRIMRSAANYNSRDRFEAWMFTVARNLVIDEARKTGRRKEDRLEGPEEDEGLSTLDREPDPGPTPEDEARGKELGAALEEALAALNPEQREVFLMRERAGLSFDEIAKATKTPLNTVKTRMHYALGHLRKTLVGRGFITEG